MEEPWGYPKLDSEVVGEGGNEWNRGYGQGSRLPNPRPPPNYHMSNTDVSASKGVDLSMKGVCV